MKQLCSAVQFSSQKVITKPSRGIEVWNKVRKEAEQEGEDEFKDERKEVRGGAGGDVQDGGWRRDLVVKETLNSKSLIKKFL